MKAKTKHTYSLLRDMCAIHAPSGDETAMRDFLLAYIKKHKHTWAHQPKLYWGEGFQDNLVLIFGKPRTAIFAHIDSIGFTVRYKKQVVKIGGPVLKSGMKLRGLKDGKFLETTLEVAIQKDKSIKSIGYTGDTLFETGTALTYVPNWREDDNYVQCCYLDNRLGVYNALRVAETLKDGAIVFSTWEEHGGGSVAYLQKFLAEKYKIRKGLISDISWISDGVNFGKGPVLTMRDSLIPRQSFVREIAALAKKNGCAFQYEVEASGGSDAKELQMAAYPWDWSFIGTPIDHVHSPDEKAHKKDLEGMIALYRLLMKKL